jgi:hypothetical protein
MKNNAERDKIIFRLWESGLTYKQIEGMKIQSFLSLRRIRNIVYGGRHRLRSDHEKEIYRLFRLKFLEVKDVHEAIMHVYNNQPPRALKERMIRYIINKQLAKRRANKDKS